MNLTKHIGLYLLVSFMIFTSCSNKSITYTQSLNKGWKLQSSSATTENGAQISTIEHQFSEAIDIDIPSTVLNALVKNGTYQDIFMGDNFKQIPTEPYRVPWWYQKKFTVEHTDRHSQLILEGVNYKANIWLNGKLIADSNRIEGAYAINQLDVTQYLQEGENCLAIEIIPPTKKDLTIGFVDWNPTPPDNNMGIWRGVSLKQTGSVSLKDVFVKSELENQKPETAELSISTRLSNLSDDAKTVQLNGRIGDMAFSKSYDLSAGESRLVTLDKTDVEGLIIDNPNLWWPNNMGEQFLYELELEVLVDGEISDKESTKFGIRTVEQYITDDGHKGYKINGQKVMIRSAGWVDDILLGDSDEKVIAQMEYVKHMNLNSVRLEGFWGSNKTLYEKADELGILLMIGWSCHWEWAVYVDRTETDKFMCIDTPEEMELQSNAYIDQVKWLRNHPSVFLWVLGSDKLPLPELERMMNDKLAAYDNTRPVLSSCRGQGVGDPNPNVSEVSGPVGVKMRGPYSYVTPNYWYIDTEYGGAYGFNTETGPGAQVPPLESMKKMIPEEDLWPIGEMWDYHNGRHAFQKLDKYIDAFNARYGKATSVEDFTFMAQAANYEAVRAMFEAFSVNKFEATGVVQWMLNSAWPETFWQLYDWYLMPNGAFYGTKSACQPLHLVYNYGDNNIYITSDNLSNIADLSAKIQVFNIEGNELLSKSMALEAKANSSALVFEMPKIKDLSKAYFLSLKLFDAEGAELSNKFYWLSTQEDVLDFENTVWHWTPNKSFADMTSLRSMEKATVDFAHVIEQRDGAHWVEVTAKNTSNHVAFFIELSLRNGETQETFLPVFWEDNYISLLPGESKTISAKIDESVVAGKPIIFEYKGVNLD